MYIYIYYINIDSFCLAKSCVPKDPPELIEPNKVMVFEGLHPIYDEKAMTTAPPPFPAVVLLQ
jgi:hypothetical protein